MNVRFKLQKEKVTGGCLPVTSLSATRSQLLYLTGDSFAAVGENQALSLMTRRRRRCLLDKPAERRVGNNRRGRGMKDTSAELDLIR